jgi:tryptophan 2,3-dioxygenase
VANQRPPIYYGDYLRLNELLGAQHLESATQTGSAAHDEMLFIIVHQAYELWFKLILYELDSVIEVFAGPRVAEKQMGQVIARLERIEAIQQVLLEQIDVIETMTPLDFLEFRDLLVPASGFQSVQFKQIEIALGLKRAMRIRADQEFLLSRLRAEDQALLEACENRTSLLELTERWLERMPFLQFEGFQFWQEYASAVEAMLQSDRHIIESNPTLSERERAFQLADLEATGQRFQALLDDKRFAELQNQGEFRLSRTATLAALFIHLYRDEPILQAPFRYLTHLIEIDENFTTWRARHAIMVQRMLGTKIGTGGSSGHDYLSRTTQQNRVFLDLFNLSTFLIPRSKLPRLPSGLIQSLGFQFSGTNTN